MSIDTHIHLFTRLLPRADGIRHDPDYDATLADLTAASAESGIRRFVVVQPSFLGCDNSYLLEQIRMHPEQLAGVAVLDPSTTDDEIAALHAGGIRGVRLNLLKRDLETELAEPALRLVQRCSEQGLHVEVHDDGARLPFILNKLAPLAKTLVIDHFGRPDPARGGIGSSEFRELLALGEHRDWYVKISAPYRCPGVEVADAFRLFRQQWGVERLLWGSDWPWTQHESAIRYRNWCEPFMGEGNLAVLLEQNAAELFGFTTAASASCAMR